MPVTKGNVAQALRSAVGSCATFGVYLGTSTYLDDYVGPVSSNAIGIAVGATINFGLQLQAFGARLQHCRGGPLSTCLRYGIAEFMIVTSQQASFVGGMHLMQRYDHWKSDAHEVLGEKYKIMGLRGVSQAAVFTGISFPLRKHWVFVR